MSGTQMPRGILRGCQQRLSTLSDYSLASLIATLTIRALFVSVSVLFLGCTGALRVVEWWQELPEEGSSMDLRALLGNLSEEFSFEVKYPVGDIKLELAVAVINHLQQLPVGTFFWEPTGDFECVITLNWDVQCSYRVVSCQSLGNGSCSCRVLLRRLDIS